MYTMLVFHSRLAPPPNLGPRGPHFQIALEIHKTLVQFFTQEVLTSKLLPIQRFLVKRIGLPNHGYYCIA